MDAKTCLEKMRLVGTLAMATVDSDGSPQIRCVSAVHYEPDALYFFTARGKAMARQLLADGRVQTMVRTRFNEMIRMSGAVKPAPKDEQEMWMDKIFEEQPYLANVYPGKTREIGIIFKIEDIMLEYFNLGVHPIERGTYKLDGAVNTVKKGYFISDECIGCGTCASVCPQKCIVDGSPYTIAENHCLHCGACFENCPVNAVERY